MRTKRVLTVVLTVLTRFSEVPNRFEGVYKDGKVAGTSRSPEPSDFVFTKPGGGPYHPQYLSKLLGAFTKELGLPRLTAHGLRHTSATLMASGVPPKVAAERLGHADPTLFSNLYSHVTPTMQKEAAAKIGTALFGPGPAV